MKTGVLSFCGAMILWFPACSGPSRNDGSTGVGGGAGAGGSSATGGASGAGGAFATGGSSGAGGAAGTGGATSTGGSSPTGGASGAGGGVNSCSFVACGGSLVGTWQYVAECFDKTPSVGNEACPITSMTTDMQVTGSITFNADGSWTGDDSSTTAYAYSLPATCIDAAGCANERFTLSADNCVFDATSGCLCTVQYSIAVTQHGTYTVAGDQLTIVAVYPNTTTSATYAFCTSGNTLQYSDYPPAADARIFTLSKSP
jgi:hypothetical protein